MAKHNFPVESITAPAAPASTLEDPKEVIDARPAAGELKDWRVTLNGQVYRVKAVNDRDAWALCCDANKVWPSPKSGSVVAA